MIGLREDRCDSCLVVEPRTDANQSLTSPNAAGFALSCIRHRRPGTSSFRCPTLGEALVSPRETSWHVLKGPSTGIFFEMNPPRFLYYNICVCMCVCVCVCVNVGYCNLIEVVRDNCYIFKQRDPLCCKVSSFF